MRGAVAHRLVKAKVVEVGDALVRGQHPFASMGELADAVGEHRSHRGACLLQRAFSTVRPGVDSSVETVIRLNKSHLWSEHYVIHKVKAGLEDAGWRD